MPSEVIPPSWKLGTELEWSLCASEDGWERMTLWNVASNADETNGGRPKHLIPQTPASGMSEAIALGSRFAASRSPAGAPTTVVYGKYLIRAINQTRRLLIMRNPGVVPTRVARFVCTVGEGEFYSAWADGTITYTLGGAEAQVDLGAARLDTNLADPAKYGFAMNGLIQKGGLKDAYALLRTPGENHTRLYLFRAGVMAEVLFFDPVFGGTHGQIVATDLKDGLYMVPRAEVSPMGEYAALWVWRGDYGTSLFALNGSTAKIVDYAPYATRSSFKLGRMVQISRTHAIYARNGTDRSDAHNGMASMVFAVNLGDNSAPLLVNRETFFSGGGTVPGLPQVMPFGGGSAAFTTRTYRVLDGGYYSRQEIYEALYSYGDGAVVQLIPQRKVVDQYANSDITLIPSGDGSGLVLWWLGYGNTGGNLGYEYFRVLPGEPALSLANMKGDMFRASLLTSEGALQVLAAQGPNIPAGAFQPTHRVWQIGDSAQLLGTLTLGMYGAALGNIEVAATSVRTHSGVDLFVVNVTNIFIGDSASAGVSLWGMVPSAPSGQHTLQGVDIPAARATSTGQRGLLGTFGSGGQRSVFVSVADGAIHARFVSAPGTPSKFVHQMRDASVLTVGGDLNLVSYVGAPTADSPGFTSSVLAPSANALWDIDAQALPDDSSTHVVSVPRKFIATGQNMFEYWPGLRGDLTEEVFARN